MVNAVIWVIIIVAVIVLVIMLAKTLFKWAFIVFLLILLVYGASLFFNKGVLPTGAVVGDRYEVNETGFNVSCSVDVDCSTWIGVNNGCYHECVEKECDSAVLCPVVNNSELERLRNTRCVVNLGCLKGEIKCVDSKCVNIVS